MDSMMLHKTVKTISLMLIIAAVNISTAASTAQIDEVRKKDSLTSDDLAIVDSFITDSFTEMLESPTVADSVKRREDILVRRPKEDNLQYRQQFLESIDKNVRSAMQAMQTWTEPVFIEATKLNLAVIIGSLDDISLSDIAIEMADQDNPALKYWALKAITTDKVTEVIKANTTSQQAASILQTVNNAATENTPAILRMLAEFASRLGGSEAVEILSKIAQTRIEAYKNHAASMESTDGVILEAIASVISSNNNANSSLAAPFAQLLAFPMEKCLIFLAPEGNTSSPSWQQLLTLTAMAEKDILPKFEISTNLLRAVERRSLKDFTDEYNRLFGEDGTGGELTAKLGISTTIEKLPQR